LLYRQELKKAINQEDNNINRADYDVNLLDMIEEDRIIKGIHDVYGKLYDELGFDKLLYNPARNVASCKALKEIVLARVANPDSKRRSVLNLQENFAVNLDLKAVYKMMDKIDIMLPALQEVQFNEFNSSSNITYIVGARIKNMNKSLKEKILNMDNYKAINDNTKVATFDYQGKKLLVSYSDKRARKDKFEREKGIQKLRDKLEKNKSVKTHLSNQGYKKYLQLEQRVKLQYIKLSAEKIRKILLSVQVSVLYDTKTDKKFAIPSKISADAKKIYKLMEVPISSTPYKLCSA